MLDEVSSVNGQIILEHTIRMMQCIGKSLVVEGAETAQAVELLRSMGCDYIQGFYYSKPLPQSEFVAFLKKYNNNEHTPHHHRRELTQ
jgi:EAL domain-containing protein (putative c-di-GMP-specific phosphodiesterase class I)